MVIYTSVESDRTGNRGLLENLYVIFWVVSTLLLLLLGIYKCYLFLLGHHLQEIRERAITNIVFKLDRGCEFDDELACSKELFSRLIQWFSFQSFLHQDSAINLLIRIFKVSERAF